MGHYAHAPRWVLPVRFWPCMAVGGVGGRYFLTRAKTYQTPDRKKGTGPAPRRVLPGRALAYGRGRGGEWILVNTGKDSPPSTQGRRATAADGRMRRPSRWRFGRIGERRRPCFPATLDGADGPLRWRRLFVGAYHAGSAIPWPRRPRRPDRFPTTIPPAVTPRAPSTAVDGHQTMTGPDGVFTPWGQLGTFRREAFRADCGRERRDNLGHFGTFSMV